MSTAAINGTLPSEQTRWSQLKAKYSRVREFTSKIVEPLSDEDCVIQSMPDVSPTRWHLAHTTWFFEAFLLDRRSNYLRFDDSYEYLFNSYYNTVGEQFPRHKRGLLSRPGVKDVLCYREHVDQHLLNEIDAGSLSDHELEILEVGLNHEQQHQELMLTDIKHVLSCNPLYPSYANSPAKATLATQSLQYETFEEGLYEIGHNENTFAYDNESPRHRVFLESFELGRRLVTVGEYIQFIEDGGYDRPEHWLSAGWSVVREQQWTAPLYWVKDSGAWMHFTLSGLRPVDPETPVCHISYFEADAYARWAGARLPSEAEWEIASENQPINGNFADHLLRDGHTIHPSGCDSIERESSLCEMFGDVWEWTYSPYVRYPRYKVPEGALGEYNGKFMCGQFVLRGGSCATSSDHVRRTYRNFFPPDARWQFSGIRLARDLDE